MRFYLLSYRNDYIEIISFLRNITLKNENEKKEFFM